MYQDYDHDIRKIYDKLREEDSRVHAFVTKHRRRYSRKYIIAWYEVILSQRRKELNKEVEGLKVYGFKKRGILAALSAVAIGVNSKKKILQRRRETLDEARLSLMEKLERKKQTNGVISTGMLQNELRRLLYNELNQWDKKRYLSAPFQEMKVAMKRVRIQRATAESHFAKKHLKKYLSQWYHFCYPEGNRRIVRFDQSKVDKFSALTTTKVAFKLWYKYARIRTKAAIMHRKALTNFVYSYFQEWRYQTRKQCLLRKDAFEAWKDFGNIVRRDPFLAWREWAFLHRRERNVNERFLRSHRRIKARRILLKCFRHWGHCIAYDRASALYSRSELMMQIERNTRRIQELEGAARLSASDDETPAQLRRLISNLHMEEIAKDETIAGLQMQLRKAKEDIDYARSLVDLAQMDPHVLKYISSRHAFTASL